MTWSIHGVGLAAHDLALSATFFQTFLGLGSARPLGPDVIGFGGDTTRLRLTRPARELRLHGGQLNGPIGARHLAVAVQDLGAVIARLDRATLAHVPADPDRFGAPAVFTQDPARNVVAFVQRGATAPSADWTIHHVNLEAPDVREAVGFYVEIAGMAEGRWRAPAERGDFSIDPAALAVLPLGEDNSGLHIIRADPGFALRNGFAHNPSIGGHPAFCVPDVRAVKRRLEEAGHLVSDAGVYAMAGMHQIYVFDPMTNMIEVNQVV